MGDAMAGGWEDKSEKRGRGETGGEKGEMGREKVQRENSRMEKDPSLIN